LPEYPSKYLAFKDVVVTSFLLTIIVLNGPPSHKSFEMSFLEKKKSS